MWWIKLKIRQFKVILANIWLLPDLKLRTLVIIFSLCMIVSSFFIGLMIGRSSSAQKLTSISGADEYVPFDNDILDLSKKQSEPLKDSDKNFVASDGGKVYYYKTCKGYTRIKEENRVWFKTELLAKASGYTLAKNCGIPK